MNAQTDIFGELHETENEPEPVPVVTGVQIRLFEPQMEGQLELVGE